MDTHTSRGFRGRTAWRMISLVGCLVAGATVAMAQHTAALQQIATIPLPNVHGRIDHFGIDLQGQRLFMSALGNNTVEVLNLKTNARLHTITGLAEPQGVTYAPEGNRLFVANGGDGKLRIFDGSTYSLLTTVALGSDADDTRYDAGSHRVYAGFGEGGIAVFNAGDGKLLSKISLPAHPEAFEAVPGGSTLFINLTDANEIAVADAAQRRLIAHWPMRKFSANFPMALDASGRRLFIVTRRPPQLLVFDTASGSMVAHLPAAGDADDVWYDAANRRIYVSGGAGLISVIQQSDADHYTSEPPLATAAGARTSYFVPELGRLYLAVPRRFSREAAVRVYAVGH
ncbi:MAG: hypothetical protein ACRD1E_12220 [Terriglobales bacterium]